MDAKHLLSPNTISELYQAMSAMGIEELTKWREHVIGNPYSLEGVSQKIIEMLDERIADVSKDKSQESETGINPS
jgi:hypothetical protein